MPSNTWAGPDAIVLYDMVTGKEIHRLPTKRGINCLRFSPDGKILACGGDWGQKVQLWDTITWKELRSFENEDIHDLAFSTDGRHLALAAWSIVQVRETGTGRSLVKLGPDGDAHRTVGLTPDGRTLLDTSYHKIRFVEVATGKVRFEFLSTPMHLGHQGAVHPGGLGTMLRW